MSPPRDDESPLMSLHPGAATLLPRCAVASPHEGSASSLHQVQGSTDLRLDLGETS